MPDGQKPDNDKAFSACYQFLENNNTLMVFPEGTSIHELKVRKIKTGTARIALGVESKNNFALGLSIVPIGLYYSNPSKFGSKLHVNVGQPIPISGYQEANELNPIATAQQLTNDLKDAFEELTITTKDKEEELLFYRIKKIYKTHLLKTHRQKGEKNEEFRLTREIANAIQYFHTVHPEKFEIIKTKIASFNFLTDSNSDSINSTSRLKNILLPFLTSLYLLIGAPLFIIGATLNYLPFQAPGWISRAITKEKEYRASIMLAIGIFLFPIYYVAANIVVHQLIGPHPYQTIITFIILPTTGLYAYHYYLTWGRFVKMIQNLKLSWRYTDLSHEIIKLKKELIEDLEEARVIYLNKI